MNSGIPRADTVIPKRVAELAGADAVEPVWRNELGGLTFRVSGRDHTRYIKWQPHGDLGPGELREVDLVAEAERLGWAGRFTRVPRVLEVGASDGGAWLVTEGIDAVSAADPRWRDRPEVVVRAIATGLRRLHDSLPVEESPYLGTWPGTTVSRNGETDHLVVCHGDPCVPNTLMSEDGDFVGHVDLGRLGVADRWADLAIATYSIRWDINFGRDFDELFFATYGVQPDEEKVRTYRELWDAS